MEIRQALEGVFDQPILLNINTHRKFWHAGAGIDDENIFDRYENEKNALGQEAIEIHDHYYNEVRKKWKQLLETQ
jgi:hypothetical protein